VPCKIVGRKAFILRPDTGTGKHGDPPERILEIATDVNLRDTYKFKDGDIVEVEVSENNVQPIDEPPTPKAFASRLAPLRSNFNVFAMTPCRGLSLSR
jgi:hypothetical protein